MSPELILSVRVQRNHNPLRPLSYIDLGHADVILWAPPELPESFGFYPEHPTKVVASVFEPQRARMERTNTFTRVPAYWRAWKIEDGPFIAVRHYLDQVCAGCIEGSIRYDGLRFNCLHLAHRCLQVGGLNPKPVPEQKILMWSAATPAAFIETLMPDAHYSVMYHELAQSEANASTGE